MLGSSTSRILQHRPRRLHVFYTSLGRRNRSAVSQHASAATNLRDSNDDETASSPHQRYFLGVPQPIHVRSFSSTTTTTGGVNTNNNDSQESLRERATEGALRARVTVADMARQYGPVFVGTYASVYIATLASIYGGIQSGVVDPVAIMDWIHPKDGESAASTVHVVVEWMEQYSFTKPYAPMLEKHPYVANFAVAWIAAKITEPIRLAATIAVTPRLARYFGYIAPSEEEGEAMQEDNVGKIGDEAEEQKKITDEVETRKEP